MALISRKFVSDGESVKDLFKWNRRDVMITSASGAVIFEAKDVEAPIAWSDRAVEIIASKYFRLKYAINANLDGDVEKGNRENSVWEVVHRLALCWARWGARQKLLTAEQASILYDEAAYTMLKQMAAPNSPQFFNTGLFEAYNVAGTAQGHSFYNEETGQVEQTTDAYSRPQPSACFILDVDDDLVGDNGIMELWRKESRLFKQGSGTGSNFSKLRAKGELLNNGGTSGGLMPWLKIGDCAAGAIKSGGTTRRAAKMVCLDLDHPEAPDFIVWKVREELKVKALVAGHALGMTDKDYALTAKAVNLNLDFDFQGDAYGTVSGQNANNSIRVPDHFFKNWDQPWLFRDRLTGASNREWPRQKLWDLICFAAWNCADPGLQFHDTINWWHTCKTSGPIRASNPCSEYMFLDNTACNLASINIKNTGGEFQHVCRLWTIILEISVGMASYPTPEVAMQSWRYRTLGLGVANVGAWLMSRGLEYDSDAGRTNVAEVCSLMTAVAYETSQDMADILGPFQGYENNAEDMKRVIQSHMWFAGVNVPSMPRAKGEEFRLSPVRSSPWDRVLLRQNQPDFRGYRNAQVTVIAPTGTISFLMDCDTTGIEPEFALTKTKTLVGGGSMVITNHSVREALMALWYTKRATEEILGAVKDGANIQDIVRPEHRGVFACAVGKDAIHPHGHVKMLAAVQPHISGAISKTVNMPSSATMQDVAAVYEMAWKSGVKAIAVYRDNSKGSQPLNAGQTPAGSAPVPLQPKDPTPYASYGTRRFPSKTRASVTHHFNVGGQGGYVTVGMYDDATPCELFLRMSKAGSTMHGLCECFGRAISMALQHGMPIAEAVASFRHLRFEPFGMTDDKDIPFASSVVDYVFRWIEKQFGQPTEDRATETSPTTSDADSGLSCPVCGSMMHFAGRCLHCPNCQHTGGCS